MPRKKKEFKRKRVIITDDLFRFSWFVQRGGQCTEAIAWYLKKEGLPPDPSIREEDTRGGFFYRAEYMRDCLIWLREDAGSNMIMHEIQHGIITLGDLLQIQISEQTTELFAHYAGWLSEQIVRKLWC